eukprot:scaffold112087_cov64-Attheya_sp.AAC.2
MLFSVSIRDGSGKEIVSEVLCGDQLDTLKRRGFAGILLESPIIIGTYPAAPVDAYFGYAKSDAECDNWSVTVHLFRLDQNKCCCVHESFGRRDCDWEFLSDGRVPYYGRETYYRGVDAVNALLGWARYDSDTLELDKGGKVLLGLDVEDVQAIEFDVRLNCYVQEQAPARPDDPSAQTIVLEFGEVLLRLVQVDITSGDREEFIDADYDHHGVQAALPHLLERLIIWGDPDD